MIRRNDWQEGRDDPGVRRGRFDRPGDGDPGRSLPGGTEEDRREGRLRRRPARPGREGLAIGGSRSRCGGTSRRRAFRRRRTLVEFDVRGRCERGRQGRWSTSSRPGDAIDVVGQSKGKGFQGVMKRHNFGGGRATPRLDVPPRARLDRRFGVSFARHEGNADGRAHGRRPGHGQEPSRSRRSMPENNLIYVRGAVPGGRNSVVVLRAFSKNGKRGE